MGEESVFGADFLELMLLLICHRWLLGGWGFLTFAATLAEKIDNSFWGAIGMGVCGFFGRIAEDLAKWCL